MPRCTHEERRVLDTLAIRQLCERLDHRAHLLVSAFDMQHREAPLHATTEWQAARALEYLSHGLAEAKQARAPQPIADEHVREGVRLLEILTNALPDLTYAERAFLKRIGEDMMRLSRDLAEAKQAPAPQTGTGEIGELVQGLREWSVSPESIRRAATALLSQQAALAKAEERFAYIAEHLPAGWEGCTTEKELCEQIIFTVQRAETAEARIEELERQINNVGEIAARHAGAKPE